MKLRIQSDSLRLRLSVDEILQLKTNGRLEETIYFGNEEHQWLTYSLETVNDIQTVTATFEKARITIGLPEDLSQQWFETDLVGIEGEKEFADNRVLSIVVEKDLARRSKKNGIGQSEKIARINGAIAL